MPFHKKKVTRSCGHEREHAYLAAPWAHQDAMDAIDRWAQGPCDECKPWRREWGKRKMDVCPKPDYERVAEHLAGIIRDGGYSSNEPCELLDALTPYGWQGCGDEAETLHDALVALMRCSPFPGMWDLELCWKLARRLADLKAGSRDEMLKLKKDGWDDGIDAPARD